MTQKQLADKTGMSIPMISHMENGISNMSVITALMLLKALPDPPEIYNGIRKKMLYYDVYAKHNNKTYPDNQINDKPY